MKRIFLFGCSFSNWIWPTLADYVSLAFDRRIVMANPGVSNRFLANRLIEVITSREFNPREDHVFFQTTGWGRFCYYERTRNTWRADGDLFSTPDRINTHRELQENYGHAIFSPDQAVYDSYLALKTVDQLLRAQNISHTLVVGLDFVELFDPFLKYEFSQEIQEKVLDLEQHYLQGRSSLYRFGCEQQGRVGYNRQFQDGTSDGHPYPEDMYQYLRQYFPEYATDLAAEFHQRALESFDWSGFRAQSERYAQLKHQYKITPITSSYVTSLFLPEDYLKFRGVRF